MNCFLYKFALILIDFKTKTFHPFEFLIPSFILETGQEECVAWFGIFIELRDNVLSPFEKITKVVRREVFICFENKHAEVWVKEGNIDNSFWIFWMVHKSKVFAFNSKVFY